jgi:hypothetical protein
LDSFNIMSFLSSWGVGLRASPLVSIFVSLFGEDALNNEAREWGAHRTKEANTYKTLGQG